jgi:hypothetical protein
MITTFSCESTRSKPIPKLQFCFHYKSFPLQNPGTPTNPCFPLQKLWQYTLIPAIAQLVDTGGPCEGATVVVQQDNAGPYIEEAYSIWIHEQFDMLGWMYEPQAPQGIQHEMSSLAY